MPVVNIPRVGRVNFPDSMSQEEIATAAAQLAERRADPDAVPDLAMWGVESGTDGRSAPITLPFGLGQFRVKGGIADLVRGASSIKEETSFPIVGATMATAAAPATFAGALLAAAAGGGLGGAAAESNDPDATAGSIAKEGLKSGAEMAAAELMGMGLGAAARRIAAPNLKFMDPLKGVRSELAKRTGRITDAVRSLPALQGAQASSASRHMARLGKIVSHPVGGEVAEIAATPLIGAMFGPGTALAVSLGKAILHPGPVARYLANNKLPSPVIRSAADQATRLALRGFMAKEEKD